MHTNHYYIIIVHRMLDTYRHVGYFPKFNVNNLRFKKMMHREALVVAAEEEEKKDNIENNNNRK